MPDFAAGARSVDTATALERVPAARPAPARTGSRRRRLSLGNRHSLRGGRDASDHPVPGGSCGAIPVRPESWSARVFWPVVFFVAKHVVTRRTPIGRKEMPEIRFHGGPMLRVKRGGPRTVAASSGCRSGVRRRRRPAGDRRTGAVIEVAQRHLVYRFPSGVRLDRSADLRDRRLAGGDAGSGRIGARAVLLRAGLPVRVQLHGVARRRPGCRVYRPPRPNRGGVSRLISGVGRVLSLKRCSIGCGGCSYVGIGRGQVPRCRRSPSRAASRRRQHGPGHGHLSDRRRRGAVRVWQAAYAEGIGHRGRVGCRPGRLLARHGLHPPGRTRRGRRLGRPRSAIARTGDRTMSSNGATC